MIDISATYHIQPDYEDVLKSIEPEVYPMFDADVRFFGYRRKVRKLYRLLHKEHIRIGHHHLPPSVKRTLPWLEEIKRIVARADREPQRIHRRIYLDALRRAELNEQKGNEQ